jgi:hypothetical protein
VNTDVQCLHIDLANGKYTAHPSVKLENYLTNIPISTPFVMEDMEYINRRSLDRLPSTKQEEEILFNRLFTLEAIIEALTILLIEDLGISRKEIQRTFDLVVKYLIVGNEEKLDAETIYQRRSMAYRQPDTNKSLKLKKSGKTKKLSH